MKKTEILRWNLLDKLARGARKRGQTESKTCHALVMAALVAPFLVVSQSTSAAALASEVPLHGFADVGYKHVSQDLSGDKPSRGFTTGSLDLYFTPQFGDRVKTLVELFFGFSETDSLDTDLERIQLGYAISDSTTVWLGRFHTPLGYWNAAFHHGAQIQTSVLRPRFIEFEDHGGILPLHTTGLWATGKYRMPQGALTYDVYIGNGSRFLSDASSGVSLVPNNTRDDNGNKAVGFNLGYEFGGYLEGLRLGAHGLREEIDTYASASPASSAPLNRLNFKTVGGYLVYINSDWEGIAEYYRFNNQDLSAGAGSNRSWASFAQLGHSFSTGLTPYARTEKADLNQNDIFFSQQTNGRSYTRQVLGIRYDLNTRAAIKFEINRTKQTDSPPSAGSFNEARAQYAIRF